jgi:broad specificity phosphatase PhoE
MDIYIVRHCKAEGQSPDANLTDEGYLQAEAESFDNVDTSVNLL